MLGPGGMSLCPGGPVPGRWGGQALCYCGGPGRALPLLPLWWGGLIALLTEVLGQAEHFAADESGWSVGPLWRRPGGWSLLSSLRCWSRLSALLLMRQVSLSLAVEEAGLASGSAHRGVKAG